MSVINAILFGVAVAAIGSLPPGMISMTIVDQSIKRSSRYGVFMALGASLVELLQVALVFYLLRSIGWDEGMNHILRRIAQAIFLAFGIYYLRLFFYPENTQPPDAKKLRSHQAILAGSGISLLNVLVFPYWVLYLGYAQSHGWIHLADSSSTWLIIGSFMGTWLVLSLYALTAAHFEQRLSKYIRHVYGAIGLIFLVLLMMSGTSTG